MTRGPSPHRPKPQASAERSRHLRVEFEGLEYHEDDRVQAAAYTLEGSGAEGWCVTRNGAKHLELGPGYRLLRTDRCGICSTDLDRRFLPFPLPQIIGHELIALDAEDQRHVVEINASHQARGLAVECPFCDAGLDTHCPERRVLGIHDLPGGFGPWVLAAENAVFALPRSLPDDVAVLMEPFAAALHAAEWIDPQPGETVAVLGPRRLGLLVVAALAARRRRDAATFRILALSRHDDLSRIALSFGADHAAHPSGESGGPEPVADIVIDTTGSPAGLETALGLARREVHLKSTHGQPAAGLVHATELVVDEISLEAWPEDPGALRALLASAPCRAGDPPQIAWLSEGVPPENLSQALPAGADLRVGRDAGNLLERWEQIPGGRLPRADIAIVDNVEAVDRVLRPRLPDEISLVRPRGRICIRNPQVESGPLGRALVQRGLRLSGSRCGNFRKALPLLESDSALRGCLAQLVTHRLAAGELPQALRLAREPGCIKIVLAHPESEAAWPEARNGQK